ncbi:MAG: RNA polymerase sigma factor [Flavobacteriaceae bacterium]
MEKHEKQIFRLIQDQNIGKALQLIMDSYHELLYWHIRKWVGVHEDANDVLQNTYIRIYKGLTAFKFKSSVKTWSYRIAYNESMRHLDRLGRKGLSVAGEGAQKYFDSLQSDPYFDLEACNQRMIILLEQLPERSKQVFMMKDFDELTFDEVAAILQLNPNTVKSIYYKTKTQLLESLKQAI